MEKQIEEMAKEICSEYDCVIPCQSCGYFEYANCRDVKSATKLYNAGYRKTSDVAREIFNDIENALYSSYYCAETEDSILTFTLNKLNEAKHKHLDANFFVKMTGFSEPPIPHTIESIADLTFPENEGNK